VPRARVNINVDELEKLARLQCTEAEVAAFFQCSERTVIRYLNNRKFPEYREAWERGRALGRMSLRRLQWQHANGKGASAVQMTIHLSKHWLGESERALAVDPGHSLPRVTSPASQTSEGVPLKQQTADGREVAYEAPNITRLADHKR
jgi:hypothetical protein